MSELESRAAAETPIRAAEMVLDPKTLTPITELAANERADFRAHGRWSTHPHGGPNFTGPGGDPGNLLGQWPQGCVVIVANRGKIPFEVTPMLSDNGTVSVSGSADGECKIMGGAHDDPHGFDDNFNQPGNPMKVSFNVFRK